MSHIYTDVFTVLRAIEEEFGQMEQRLNAIPQVRGELYRSIVLPDSNQFQPIDMCDGTIAMFPGNQSLYVFRGQPQDYGSCCASMYRNDPTDTDILLRRLQQVEFELVLSKHPAVQDIASGPARISFLGLAQHYGIPTDYLDVTSDPYVAAFFAVCRWCKSQRTFIPIREQSEPGLVMKAPQLVYSPPMTDKLEPVGLQPFPRPSAQKALAVRLSSGEQFSAHEMRFHHSQDSSEKIYARFNGGQSLLPADPIEAKALEIQNPLARGDAKVYSREAFEEVLARYDYPQDPKFYVRQLRDSHVLIASESPHHFTTAEIDQFRHDWETTGRRQFLAQVGPVRLQYS